MDSPSQRNPDRSRSEVGPSRWRRCATAIALAAGLIAVAGCGGGGSSKSSAGGGSGESGGIGSQGHSIRARPDLNATSTNIHGQTIDGELYVRLEPSTGVEDVTFWLDDTSGSGEPYQFEGNPPFDFNGGTSAEPRIWDTTDVPDGEHQITAELLYTDGTSEMFSATFTVNNSVPAVTTNKSTVSFQFAEDESGTTSTTAQLALSTGGSAPYTLGYTGASWLTVTRSSTSLPSTVTFAVNANNVAVGTHQVEVTASAAGFASAEIMVTLVITPGAPPPSTPVITFDDQLIRHDYYLDSPGANTSTVTLSATDDASAPFTLSYASLPWLSVSPNSGTIPASIQVSVTSVGLAAGVYETDVVASVPGYANASVTVRVTVSSGSASLAASISQEGFTWYFDDEYEIGQFVNGDYYVVGPVTITSVSPSWTGTYDGSMINPIYGDDHGYDGRWNFESTMRVNTNNFVLDPGESLITVDSWRDGEAGAPSSANTLGIPRPAIKDAAVLTCLASHPPAGSFRPPYGGSAKPLHNVSQLRTWLLPQLDPPSNTPSLGEIENNFEGIWLDHTVKWKNRYLHPDDNMADYSRNFASDFNTGSLMLMLDFTDAQKETLMIRLVQIGIDQFAILQSGGEWGADAGGIGSGRKWPILLAGILLDDPDMMDIGSDYGPITALEDCQTFYLTSGDAADYPGESVGDPVWGERHCDQPDTDPGNTSYRTCCTANAWVGAVLSVHILTGETAIDVKALWNHDPLFDYQDKYMDEREPGDWKRSWSAFQESMWDTYRADYGPVWVN